jgi:hypothetical protein
MISVVRPPHSGQVRVERFSIGFIDFLPKRFGAQRVFQFGLRHPIIGAT